MPGLGPRGGSRAGGHLGFFPSYTCGTWGLQSGSLTLTPCSLGAGAEYGVSWRSLMSGLATMEPRACGKMGVITITYYLWTTFMAVTIGIILVVSIHPGVAAQKEDYSAGKVVLSSADALLDLIRCVVGSGSSVGAAGHDFLGILQHTGPPLGLSSHKIASSSPAPPQL